jgi:hypothetical protein
MRQIKTYESFRNQDYYRLLTSLDEYGRDPLFNFDYRSVRKIVSLFNNSNWKIYIKMVNFLGKRYDISILPSDKDLKWFCFGDMEEAKKYEKYSDDPKNTVKHITIFHNNFGYQIYNYDDAYYTLNVNDIFGNSIEKWEADQLDGLVELLKDKILLSD